MFVSAFQPSGIAVSRQVNPHQIAAAMHKLKADG
jgi:hypothetical protein